MFFRFYDIAKDFVLVLSKIVYVKGRREENWGGDERDLEGEKSENRLQERPTGYMDLRLSGVT
jgi:hypothetical protein